MNKEELTDNITDYIDSVLSQIEKTPGEYIDKDTVKTILFSISAKCILLR